MGFLQNATDRLSSALMGEEPKLSSPQDQTGEEQKLVSFVDEKLEERRNSGPRVSNEAIWFTNIAALMGYDNIYFDPKLRRFRPLEGALIDTNRLSVNKILPTVQNRLARLCKNPPRYDVRPNSQDQDDKDAAQLGLKLINNVWDVEHVNQKRLELMMWVQQCGHAWVKVLWDTEKGRDLQNPESGEIEKEGDIGIDVISPFEVFPDDLARSQDDLSDLIQASIRPLSYFRAKYPERGHLVKSEDSYMASLQNLQKINNTTNLGPGSSSSVPIKNAAIEKAYYEKPSKKHPNGRMIVVAGGVLLMDKELPCGKLPFAKFDDVVIAGKFYSESIITHLRPIQQQYNTLIRRRAEWVKKLLAGKYLAPRGSGLIREALNDETGEVLEFDAIPNAPVPQAMQIPMIPQYAYMEEDRLNEQFNEISGISEVSKGQMPSASIPAIGMQLLVEQDDTRIGIVTENNEYSWAKVGTLILDYAEKYYTQERTLKEVGSSGEYLIHKVSGENLRENKDVIVIRGSTLPGSKVLKRQEILNLYSQGMLGDPNDPALREKVLAQLEYGDLAESWKDISLDKAQIKNDLELIKQNVIPDVHEMDNHALHIKLKNQFRKGSSYEKLSPIGKEILEENVESHVEWIVKLTMPPMPPPMPQVGAPPEVQEDAGLNPEFSNEPMPPQEPEVGGL